MAGGDLFVVTLAFDRVEVHARAALRVKVASAVVGKQHAV